ncbi:uncharacterized protein LOC117537788 isoform X2 [Gymnodraco acuticeps]|uniref:Uncharacterized protein LOC117537788 isoform X2 n=1 Tax=Gymnodraco acuticeps TaxID=8218 RepID=A0A6P8T5T1_GYMAC|nr:uncharacterized protein LOC117537788 isoform X2 [Gymnodraco acuticeps]XP_034059045.1 uncharacterized protein LOC117537788 isoform X2 [Gymnodraco acuticeps]
MNYPTIPALRFIDLDAITKQCVEILCAENPNVWGHRIIEILAQDTLSQIRPLIVERICFALGAYLNLPSVESGEVYNTDRGSVYQNFPPVEFTHNLPFEVTADPLRTAVALPRDSDNQAYTPLFNAPLQPLGSETFMQIPPELQADFYTYSAYLDDFELQPDMLISSQTDSSPSPQFEGDSGRYITPHRSPPDEILPRSVKLLPGGPPLLLLPTLWTHPLNKLEGLM